MEKDFFITQPRLYNLVEFTKILSRAWNEKILANQGHLHREFESKLSNFLGACHLSLCNSTTSSLIIAQKHLTLKVK